MKGIPGKGSKVFRELFGEIEDPRYSIFNAMTNLSAVARTATYFDDVAKLKIQKYNKLVVEDFFGIQKNLQNKLLTHQKQVLKL